MTSAVCLQHNKLISISKLDVFRVEMQMPWLFILEKIQHVAHLSKVVVSLSKFVNAY